jgi:hypothetical protein
MVPRHGHRRGQEGRGRIGRFGLLLALLAVLCQSLALLPQSAMAMPMVAPSALPADAALFAGGYILCQDDDGTAAPASDGKAPCQHCVDCPLCQVAFHIGSALVPPPAPVLPPPSAQAIALARAVSAPARYFFAATSHQPRAPPSVTSL